MYAAVRQYKSKPGVTDQLAERIKDVVPIISGVSGFMGYYVVYAPDDTVTAISIFNKVEEAEEFEPSCSRLGGGEPRVVLRRPGDGHRGPGHRPFGAVALSAFAAALPDLMLALIRARGAVADVNDRALQEITGPWPTLPPGSQAPALLSAPRNLTQTGCPRSPDELVTHVPLFPRSGVRSKTATSPNFVCQRSSFFTLAMHLSLSTNFSFRRFDLVLGPSLHRLPPQQPHLLHDPLLDRIGLLEVSLAVLYRPNYRRESIAKTRVRLETGQNRLVAECSGRHLLNSHPFPNPNLTPQPRGASVLDEERATAKSNGTLPFAISNNAFAAMPSFFISARRSVIGSVSAHTAPTQQAIAIAVVVKRFTGLSLLGPCRTLEAEDLFDRRRRCEGAIARGKTTSPGSASPSRGAAPGDERDACRRAGEWRDGHCMHRNGGGLKMYYNKP